MGFGTDNQCGWCGSDLPHKRVTCAECGGEYDDCQDSSGSPHPQRECIASLRAQLAAERARTDALIPFAQSAREVLAFAVRIPDEHLPKAIEVLEGLEETIGAIRASRAKT
jgi:hypothetical protein